MVTLIWGMAIGSILAALGSVMGSGSGYSEESYKTHLRIHTIITLLFILIAIAASIMSFFGV